MNGIHDMGGMQGLGKLDYQKDEPVFHAVWEGRVQALTIALAAYGKWRGLRTEIELIPAADYLRMSYYERWMMALIERIRKSGLATRAELESCRAESGSVKGTAPVTAATAREKLLRTTQTALNIEVAARFRVGQRVRGRNLHPTTHTRMPGYTRVRTGVVDRDRGVFALPDNEVYFLDSKPQHVYLIRFSARELWGEGASARDAVYVDMWEDYLEPV